MQVPGIVILLLALVVQSDRPLDTYVSPNGSDENDGSICSPWAAIEKAAKEAKPGTTVHVLPGTYYVKNTIATEVSGTSVARIRFVSDQQWQAKLLSTASQIWDNTGAYVDIEGFEIISTSKNTVIGIHAEGFHDRIIGNRIHDFPSESGVCPSGAGIVMGGEVSDHSAVGNVIYNIGPAPGTCNGIHGIYAATPNCLIANNSTFNNASKGIQLWGRASNCIVINNMSFGNWDGIVVGADAALGGYNDNTKVDGNAVYSNLRYGIYETGATGRGNRYVGNIMWANAVHWALRTGAATGTIYADPRKSDRIKALSSREQPGKGSPTSACNE